MAPRAQLVIVSTKAAFRARYGVGPTVAGTYTGRLSNDGEPMEPLDAVGEKVLEYTYNDIWHTPTDGRGYALVIRDTEASFETWKAETSWAVGGAAMGTPGTAKILFSTTSLSGPHRGLPRGHKQI